MENIFKPTLRRAITFNAAKNKFVEEYPEDTKATYGLIKKMDARLVPVFKDYLAVTKKEEEDIVTPTPLPTIIPNMDMDLKEKNSNTIKSL